MNVMSCKLFEKKIFLILFLRMSMGDFIVTFTIAWEDEEQLKQRIQKT